MSTSGLFCSCNHSVADKIIFYLFVPFHINRKKNLWQVFIQKERINRHLQQTLNIFSITFNSVYSENPINICDYDYVQ